MKPPWSQRDNPVVLVVSLIGVIAVLLTLGWLTLRIGSHWSHTYIHRQSQFPE
jgi:hypothetical protein